jgi:hypothetical protein
MSKNHVPKYVPDSTELDRTRLNQLDGAALDRLQAASQRQFSVIRAQNPETDLNFQGIGIDRSDYIEPGFINPRGPKDKRNEVD